MANTDKRTNLSGGRSKPKKPITVGKRPGDGGASYKPRDPFAAGGNRPISTKPSQAGLVRSAQKTTSSGITKRPDGRAQSEGRSGRQSISRATVTSASNGKPTGGSARVTTGKGQAPKPAAKPQMVNRNSATMRQIQAKAAAARARAQGKPGIKGPINPPNSARAGKDLIRQGANRLRNLADSGQVRAAAEQGRKAMEAAQRNRARRAAGVGRGAKELQAVARVAGQARSLSPATVAYETLKARPTADGTLTAAQSGRAPSRFANARDLAMKKASAIKGSPVVGPKKSAAGQFDSAFAAARKAGKKAFTFKGKKYTTEMK